MRLLAICFALALSFVGLSHADSDWDEEHNALLNQHDIQLEDRTLSTDKSCPAAGTDVVYAPSSFNCKSNYSCVEGWAPFRITGCGCGCHRVSSPKCPVVASATVVYRSRSSTCASLSFTCVNGWQRFDIGGCGCGCRQVSSSSSTSTKNDSTVVCPSGSNFNYKSHAANCRQQFRCVRGKEFFKIAGCGCGCKVIPPTSAPVRKPAAKPT